MRMRLVSHVVVRVTSLHRLRHGLHNMKIAGKDLTAVNKEICVIPRGDDNIVFVAAAVLDWEAFDKLCPEPEPPKKRFPHGEVIDNVEDPQYVQQLREYSTKRLNWMFITSLRDTEGLEWEEVDYSNPDTWEKWKDELLAANFSTVEIGYITQAVTVANNLDVDKINQAKKDFLAGQLAQNQETTST